MGFGSNEGVNSDNWFLVFSIVEDGMGLFDGGNDLFRVGFVIVDEFVVNVDRVDNVLVIIDVSDDFLGFILYSVEILDVEEDFDINMFGSVVNVFDLVVVYIVGLYNRV